MKVKKLVIENIGIIEKEEIVFNKPLNLFYGDIKQGKTTILNAVKLCFGGGFSSDLIRHGEEEAKVLLIFENSSISRTFYIDRNGSVATRPLTYVKDGVPVDRPVDAIKELINPFLLDQNFLAKMNLPDRQRYFIDLLGIDTVEIDKEITADENKAKELRIEIKAHGETDLVEVEEPQKLEELEAELKVITDFNDIQDLKTTEYENYETAIKQAKEVVENAQKRVDRLEAASKELKKGEDENSKK